MHAMPPSTDVGIQVYAIVIPCLARLSVDNTRTGGRANNSITITILQNQCLTAVLFCSILCSLFRLQLPLAAIVVIMMCHDCPFIAIYVVMKAYYH